MRRYNPDEFGLIYEAKQKVSLTETVIFNMKSDDVCR